MSIHIRPRVLHFPSLKEDRRNHLVDLRDEFEHGEVREMFETEFPLSHVSWISFPENSMSVAGERDEIITHSPKCDSTTQTRERDIPRDNSARFECLPDEFLQLLIRHFSSTHLLDEVGDEDKDLLIRQSVKWSS